MPATPSAETARHRVQTIARQWHELAERRLAYYEELYRSGRWEFYFDSQAEFAQRMLEVIGVAKRFAEAARLNLPADAAPPPDNLRPAA